MEPPPSEGGVLKETIIYDPPNGLEMSRPASQD